MAVTLTHHGATTNRGGGLAPAHGREPGKALYKERSKAECANAWARRMGLTRLLVRGKAKARAVLLWFALAHNMLRALALRRAATVAAG
jgi:hypothetical protein